MSRKEAAIWSRIKRVSVFFVAMALCLASAGLAVSAAAQPSNPPNAAQAANPNQTMAEAQAALKRQDYAAAISDLKPLAKRYPTVAAVWFDLAYAYTGLHRNEAAVDAYRTTIKLDPNLYPARINLGILLLEMKRPADAVPQLKKAVALKPGDARAHLYLGRAEALAGDAGSGSELKEAAKLEPDSPETWLALGQRAFKQRDYESAQKDFAKSAEDPKLPEAKLGEALSLDKLGEDASAVPLLQQYLASEPNDLQARFDLAAMEMRLGQNARALASLESIQKQSPGFRGVNRALGETYALMHQFGAAEKYFRLAIGASPGSAELHRELAQTLMQQKQYSAAEAEYRTALKLNPSDRGAASGLAESLYFENKYPQAIELLVQIVQAPAAPASDYYLLAASYDHLHDVKPAITNYQEFLSLANGKFPTQQWQAQQRIKLLEQELRR